MTRKSPASHWPIKYWTGWLLFIMLLIVLSYEKGFLDVHATALTPMSLETISSSIFTTLKILLVYLATSIIPIRWLYVIPTSFFISTFDLYFLQLIFNIFHGTLLITAVSAVLTITFIGIIFELSVINIQTVDNLKYQQFEHFISRWWHSLISTIKPKWKLLVILAISYVIVLSITKS